MEHLPPLGPSTVRGIAGGDAGAWERFVRRYRPIVLDWLLHEVRLQSEDAEDVVQDAFVKLQQSNLDAAQNVLGLLVTIARQKLWEFRNTKKPLVGGENIDAAIREIESPSGLSGRLRREFDLELFEAAKAAVQAEVKPVQWECFVLLELQEVAAKEIAARLRLSLGSVYYHANKVKESLNRRIRSLQSQENENGAW